MHGTATPRHVLRQANVHRQQAAGRLIPVHPDSIRHCRAPALTQARPRWEHAVVRQPDGKDSPRGNRPGPPPASRPVPGQTVRLAVDIGGTFTDLAAQDTAAGRVVRAKTDTTPGALDRGVLAALAQSRVPAEGIAAFIHGTTVVVNAATERTGAVTALVTTRGFRDVLEIGRANRPDLYNLAYRKPAPFVPRHLRFEVGERMTYQGEVAEPVNGDDLARVADRLAGAGVQAVAVCFLHGWANPEHER